MIYGELVAKLLTSSIYRFLDRRARGRAVLQGDSLLEVHANS